MEQGAEAPHVGAGFDIEDLDGIRVLMLHRSGRVSGAATVITSDAGQNGSGIHTITVRHKHPQLEGNDFCKTPEGLETINRALICATDLQAHVTRNAAARKTACLLRASFTL